MQGPVGHRTVTDSAVTAFGTLTGDRARMHFDHEFGRSIGYGGPIAHGLLGAAWALGALTLDAGERVGLGNPNACVASCDFRFKQIVAVGDTLALRWREGEDARSTDFEMVNQRDEVATTGSVQTREGPLPEPPEPMEVGAWNPSEGPEVFFAEDLVEVGPRGESLGQTLGEGRIEAFALECGEMSPATLNAEWAAGSRFGARVASPMFVFCVGFAEFLRELLRVPMPGTSFAGHLGDAWRVIEPVFPGDTIRTRHRPLSCTRSKSRPEMAIVEFGLQQVNQHDRIVQDGRIAMMVPSRG